MYLQKAIGYNPHTKPVKEKCSLSFDPIFNQVQKLRRCTKVTGAVYHSPINDVRGGGLAAEFSIFNGGRLEVTVAPLSSSCCKGLLNCALNPVDN